MPIDFAPPPPTLQPPQITGPQYSDPLQTLAAFGQLRQQRLASQNEQLQIQQRQTALDQTKAVNQAYQNALTVGPDGTPSIDQGKLLQAVTLAGFGNAAPGILKGFQDYQKSTADLNEAQNKVRVQKLDLAGGLAATLRDADYDPHLFATAGEHAVQTGIVSRQELQPWMDQIANAYNQDPTGASAKPIVKRWSDQAISQSPQQQELLIKKATAGKDLAEMTKLGLESGGIEKQQVGQEIESAPKDPNTGSINPQALAGIRARHPNVKIPDLKTADDQDNFILSTVPVDKQPEYQLKQRQARIGMLGNEKFDQFLVQHARSITDAAHPNGKTPAELAPEEFNAGLQKYAQLTADPTLRDLLIQERGAQTAVSQAQVASLPTPQSIKYLADSLRNGTISPQQLSELRSGRVSYAPQVFMQAQKDAAAEGKTFDPAALEAQFKTRENTEQKFATGPEAQMVRSFDNLMQHTQMMNQARQALTRSDIPTLKAIGGALGVATGGTAETTYDLIADYVSNEAAKAFLPTGGGEAERAKNYSHFQRNLGNAQLDSNIKGLMGLADAQREGLERQYSQGTFGRGSQTGTLFSPQALAARDQLLGKRPTAGGGASTPTGGTKIPYKGFTKTFPDGKTRVYNGPQDAVSAKDPRNWTVVVTQ